MKSTLWQSWTNGLLGVWLALAAFLGFTDAGNLWNDIIVGLTVVVVSATILKDKPWQSWTALIVGAWMILAAFIPSLITGTGNLYNDLTSGIIIAIAGFAAYSEAEKTDDMTHMSHTAMHS